MKKISFDLDGVISDIGCPFYEQFEREYGFKAERETFINGMYLGRPWKGISGDEFQRFNNNYLKMLHREEYLSLKPFDLAISTLTQLKKEGLEIAINSSRPREFEGLLVDTFGATREWLNRFGLEFVDLQVAGNSNEKVRNICSGDFIAHVDDQVKILEGVYKCNPLIRRGLHLQLYGDQGIFPFENFITLKNWSEISSFVRGEAQD